MRAETPASGRMATSFEATPVVASVEGGAKFTGRKRSTRPLLYTRMKLGASWMTSSPPAWLLDMVLRKPGSFYLRAWIWKISN
jgi:hypothetical protein